MEGVADNSFGGRSVTLRRRLGSLAVLGLAATLLVAPSLAAGASTGHAPVAESCTEQVSALQKAPMLEDDLTPSRNSVREAALSDGTSIPVVMVHGWTGASTHDSSRSGNFSHLVDLTDVPNSTVEARASLIGIIQDVGGVSVYTFDYHDTSSRWVTDDTIGRQLANALTCLAEVHEHPAVVVAHSMGGLATRQALKLIENDGTHGPVEANVSDVITYGTPNSGSWLASVIGGADQAAKYAAAFPTAAGATITAIRSMVTLCGTATTASMTNAGLCGRLKPQLASATSQAARALTIASSEISALARWPAPVRVQALFGSADVEIVKVRWFGATIAAGSVNLGDFVVGAESGRGGAQLSQSTDCSYTLDWKAATADNLLEAMQLKWKGDTKDNVILAAGGSPCFHGNLMRDIQFSNTVLATIAELVDASTAIPAISDESVGQLLIPAGACTSWNHTRPIQLVSGQGESFDSDGSGAGILTTRLVGATDLTGDGADDAVLIVRCTGTPAAQCCAGRGSTLSTVIALDLRGATPTLIGNPFTGGTLVSSEGEVGATIYDTDTYAPVLDGTDILTYEGPLYELSDPYEVEQISGWFRHTLVEGIWNRTTE